MPAVITLLPVSTSPAPGNLDLNGNFPTFAGWYCDGERCSAGFGMITESSSDAMPGHAGLAWSASWATLEGGMAAWAVRIKDQPYRAYFSRRFCTT